MYRLTRLFPRLFLAVLMPVFIAACGSKSSSPSSGVLSGHSAVINNSTLFTFGANGFGQLGNGNTNDAHTPFAVTVGTPYSKVSIGGGHTVAIKSDGTVWTWGYNSNGQLGNGNTTNTSTPAQVGGILSGVTITQVAAGARFTLALDSNNNVYAWGNNNRGQLGINSTTDSWQPVKISALPSTISMIAAGGEFALASDGTSVWAWGSNDNGQLGSSSVTSSLVPIQVPGISGISLIAAGGSHSLAVDTSSNLWSWGYNIFGQLGNGNTTNLSTATQVTGVTGVTAISAGLDHSLAIINGSLYAWGYNFFGQIGNGATLYRNDPVTSPLKTQFSGLSPSDSVIAAGNHSIAVINGHIWTWGMNTYGQLGDGTTTDRSTPSQIQ